MAGQARIIVDDWMHGAARDMWWYPHDKSVYDGLRGAMEALHGRGPGKRIGGLFRLVMSRPGQRLYAGTALRFATASMIANGE